MNIEDVLALDDRELTTITIPEWNGAEVLVSSMTGLEKADIERKWANRKATAEPAEFKADILAVTLKRSDGTPWGTREQIGALMGKHANAIEALVKAAMKVSGWAREDVKELEKN